jgi:nicotinamide mononucleotide transporter
LPSRLFYILKFAFDLLEELKYLFSNPWELFGAITALWCVWLAAKEKILNWPVSLISVALYAKVFYDSKLYSDALLQCIFALFQVFGWVQWSQRLKRGKPHGSGLVVHSLSQNERLFTFVGIFLVWPAWYQLLVYLKPDASLPLWDSLTMVMSIAAIFLQAKKILESWWLWIVVDIIYVPIYAVKGLWLTAIIYAVFLFLAFYGLQKWSLNVRKKTADPIN